MSSRRPRPPRRGRLFSLAGSGAVLVAAGLAAGALAVPGAGGGSAPADGAPLAAFPADRYEAFALAGEDLEPAGDPSAAGASRDAATARAKHPKRASLKLSYYVGVDFQEVEPGGAQLFEIRCPEKGEQPLAGGTFAPVPGVAVVSSSRLNPQPGSVTRPRAWYLGVVNIMSTSLRWKPFVTCGTAKGIIR